MTDDRTIVDLIERVSDAEPMCACGRHTSAVWRDGVVWLDCASLLASPTSRVGRLVAFVTSPAHTHKPIVEVPPLAA
jgi:hypothetical protein